METFNRLPDPALATAWINRPISMETLRGKATMVHFWSIGCIWCRKALPEVNDLFRQHGGSINSVSVHMPCAPEELDIDAVADVCREYGIVHPVLIDNGHRLADALGNHFVPAYYFFDRTGRLIDRQSGKNGLDAIRQSIDRWMNQQRS